MLSCRKVCVSEQLLHGADICASFKEMSGERMPQRVRTHLSALHGTSRVATDHGSDVAGAHPASPAVEEEGLLLGKILASSSLRPGLRWTEERTGALEVGQQRFRSVVPHRKDPLLATLPHDLQPPTANIDVVDVQPTEFRHPQS